MKPGVSIIIPCRNEHESIWRVAKEIDEVLYLNKIPGRILIIDDNSTPRLTLESVVMFNQHNPIVIFLNILGPGLAEALRTGITYADSKFVIFMSGDGSDNRRTIPLFYDKLIEGNNCVFGQREWFKTLPLLYPPIKWFINRLGNRLISVFFDRNYSDYTDIFKGYRSDIVHIGLNCQAKGFAFPMELCLRAISSGARYAVVLTTPRTRAAGTSKFRLWHEVPEYLITLWRCLKLKWKERGKI